MIGPFGLERGLIKLSNNIASLSTGIVTNYALEGFQTILNMRASLNLGSSEDLKVAFPKTTPIKKAEVVDQKIPHPE
jgi:hypothetical protein